MANTTFRFYTEDPRSIQDFLYRNARPMIVRFHGRKVGRSAVYKMTVILDDTSAVKDFGIWLDRRSKEIRLADIGFDSISETAYRLHRSTFLDRIRLRLLGNARSKPSAIGGVAG